MITAAALQIAINTQGAQRSAAEIRSVGDAVDQTGTQSAGAGQRIGAAGAAIRGVGLGLTASVTAPILALGTSIVGMASDTNEALSAVNTVYGTAAAGVIQSSQTAATAVGLSQNQYLSATTQLSAYGKMMGLTQAQTATFADQTVTAAADLASFYNTSPEDAMAAISGGLRGEGDALERYGIIMNQATVEAYALEQGIWDGSAAMTTQQLETARSGFIMSQLTDETGSAHAAMGDFARTSGGLANQQRILKAELKDVGAQFGAVLLPIALKMVGVFQKVIGVMRDLSPHAKAVIVVIAGIAAAIGPALIGIGTLLPALANGFRVARIAMLAFTGPLGLIVAALVGLGIAYKTNFLGFGDAVRSVGSKLKELIAPFGRLTDLFQNFRTFGMNPVQAGLQALEVAFPGLQRFIDPIQATVEKLTDTFGYFRDRGASPVQAAVIALSTVFPGLRDVFVGVYVVGEKLVAVAMDLWDALSALLRGDWAGVFDGLKAAFGDALGVLGTAATVVGTLLLDAFNAIDWAAVGTALMDGLSSLWGLISTAGADLWGFLTDSFEAIDWTAMGSRAIGLLGTALSATVDFALDVVADIGSALLDGLGSAKDWIVQRWPWTGPLFDAAGTILAGAVSLVANVTGDITSALGPAWASFKALLGSIYGWLAGLFGGGGASNDDLGTDSLVLPADRTANIGLVASITGTIESALDATWDSLKSVVASVVTWFATTDPVKKSIDLLVDVLPPGVSATWDFLTTVASEIAKWAIAAAGYVLHWGGWSLAVDWASDVAQSSWDFLTNVASVIAGWAIAAAGYIIHWGGWSVAVEWATNVARGTWDFLTNVAGKLAEWAIAAVGYVLHWGGWSVTVGWATDVVKGAWDFLNNVASAIWDWVKGAAGYMLTWAGWSVTVGFATQIIKGAWDFLTNMATAIWGWIQGAAGYVIHWAGWAVVVDKTLDIAKGAWDIASDLAVMAANAVVGIVTAAVHWSGWSLILDQTSNVSSALGEVAAWLNPYVSGFLNGVVLNALNWSLSIGAPSSGITLAADFNWTELAKAAFTGTITLDPKITMDIKAIGARVGSWINGALTDPDTIKWVGIGVAALVALAFVGPGAVLTIALAAAAPLVSQAVVAFFEGVFGALDFGKIFDNIMNEITGGLANVLDGIASALDAAPDWAVPDGLVTDIRGWGDDLRALGEENGTAFNEALQQAINNGTLFGNDPARGNGPTGTPTPTLPGGAQGPVNPTAPTLPLPAGQYGPPAPVSAGGKFAGGIFADIIAQANDAKKQFGDIMLGIGTDSDTAKGSVVTALTGMVTEGLPQVASLATLGMGHFAALHLAGLTESTGLSTDVKAQFGDMQLGASSSAALTQAGVSTAFATMSATGKGHAASLSNQALGSFAALKSGATGAAGQTATDVVGKLGVMAVGGGQKAAELMGSVKNNIANSGAAGTAYSVGSNIGASLSSGLSAWLPTIRAVAADMIAAVDGAMRKKAMIASPSKMFRQTGSYLGEGLVLGFRDWMGAAGAAGSRMIDTMQSSLSSLGGVQSIAAAITAANNAGPGSGNKFYQGLAGTPWNVSPKPASWGPDRNVEPNYTAANLTDTMKVIADSLGEVLRQGEYMSDSLVHLPTRTISDLTMQLGKALAPFEGNAQAIESVFAGLKSLVATGTTKMFGNNPIGEQVKALADAIRTQYNIGPTPATVPTQPVPATPPASSYTPPASTSKPQNTYTLNQTNHLSISVKDAEEMVRLARFIDELPQAMSLVFGNFSGGTS